ncbi:MAG: hypothetical protein ABIP02_08270 [Arenimonas sp.]
MLHRKIPAVRGLYWCVEAWRQLKASPQPIFSMAMWLSLGIFLPVLNFFVMILLTVFYGGVISTLHNKTLGEKVWLGDFLNGFKSLPRFLGLFMVGFPTVLFAIFSSSILINALGPDLAKTLLESGQAPSKELLEAVAPILLDVMMKLLPIGFVIGWVIFLAVPRVMLDKRLGLLALWDAVRAIFSNLGAMLVFSLCMIIAAILASFVLAVPMSLINNAGALAGILQTFVLVFVSTLGWALYLNAMYIAWRDMFMIENSTPLFDDKNLSETRIEV